MREKTITGGIYHVLNRGVDKRIIFLGDNDYLRFIHNLSEFNDVKRVFNSGRHGLDGESGVKLIDFANQSYPDGQRKRKLLVEVLSFVLMPNHYHLLLRPKSTKGLMNFVRKLNIGYANYFNTKYERSGALFQGRYKSIRIESEAHFIHVPYYIFCNPLDLVMPHWRKGKITNFEKAMEFLENYKWSNLGDYLGKSKFSSATQPNFLLDYFEDQSNFRTRMLEWLKDMDNRLLDSDNEFFE